MDEVDADEIEAKREVLAVWKAEIARMLAELEREREQRRLALVVEAGQVVARLGFWRRVAEREARKRQALEALRERWAGEADR